MKSLLAGLITIFVLLRPAMAGLSEHDLAEVKFAPPRNGQVPLTLVLRDQDDRPISIGEAIGHRPSLLVPVDYTCRSICGPALAVLSAALDEIGFRAGIDYRLVLVGIDPKDSRDDARRFVENRLGDPGTAAAAILRADPASLDVLTAALGYHAVYDSEHDQFAHPSAALALAPDGRIVRVLSSLALDPQDLRLALTEAGEGRIGGVGDRLILMCYGFDPVHGIYTPLVHRILAAGGVLTLGLLGLALFVLHRRSSKPLEGARS